MSYVTKDQLNLYLQQVSSQSAGPGAGGTTRSRSTLTGPRPPTFGAKASSRKIFQDNNSSPTITSLKSPISPAIQQLDNTVKNLSLSPIPNTSNNRAASPILESMGESGPAEPVMESMGSDGFTVEELLRQQQQQQQMQLQQQQQQAVYGQQGWPTHGYNMGHQGYQQYPGGYANQSIPPQFYQQQPSIHMSQEQYRLLQQQQQQQQQLQQQQHLEYLRQQHAISAAAHGYQPAPPQQQQQPSTNSGSITITPRIVPIVDIPTYTVVNPPKTEVSEESEKKDDDWAPEPPPRDPPKVKPISPTADITHKPLPKISDSPSSKAASISLENSMPNDEGERIPLPPPREFRRKNASPTESTFKSSILTVKADSDGIFRPSSSPSSKSSPASSSGSSKKFDIPTKGTVSANSAKFNAMAVAGVNNNTVSSGSKIISPKSAHSSVSPVSTTTTSSTTTNSWTSRKSVDQTSPTTLSKGSAANIISHPSTDSISVSSQANSSVTSLTSPKPTVDKELPPIKPVPEVNQPITPPNVQEVHHQNHQMLNIGHLDLEHESKCIVTEEDTAGIIPRADDFSKEILVEEEKEKEKEEGKPVTNGKTSPKKPARSSSSGSTGGNPGIFVCSSCDEPISGMMITAMGKRWHSDHFVCAVCDINLEHVQFFQKDGKPYCHLDYHELFSPKCGYCNTAIENECLTALGKTWHPGHFFCRECGDPFGEDGYMVHDDHPYCENDYLRLFAPKCAGCLDPIQGDFISALKGKWHRDCFGCTVCHIGFDSTSYYVENGKPYCQTHYKSGVTQSTEA